MPSHAIISDKLALSVAQKKIFQDDFYKASLSYAKYLSGENKMTEQETIEALLEAGKIIDSMPVVMPRRRDLL